MSVTLLEKPEEEAPKVKGSIELNEEASRRLIDTLNRLYERIQIRTYGGLGRPATITDQITDTLLPAHTDLMYRQPERLEQDKSHKFKESNKWRSKVTPMLQLIAPRWYSEMQTEENPFAFVMLPSKEVLDIGDFRMCIVGEAHGFDDEYRNNCSRCYGYSSRLGRHARKGNVDRFVYNVNKFVDHYMNVHCVPR